MPSVQKAPGAVSSHVAAAWVHALIRDVHRQSIGLASRRAGPVWDFADGYLPLRPRHGRQSTCRLPKSRRLRKSWKPRPAPPINGSRVRLPALQATAGANPAVLPSQGKGRLLGVGSRDVRLLWRARLHGRSGLLVPPLPSGRSATSGFRPLLKRQGRCRGGGRRDRVLRRPRFRPPRLVPSWAVLPLRADAAGAIEHALPVPHLIGITPRGHCALIGAHARVLRAPTGALLV